MYEIYNNVKMFFICQQIISFKNCTNISIKFPVLGKYQNINYYIKNKLQLSNSNKKIVLQFGLLLVYL